MLVLKILEEFFLPSVFIFILILSGAILLFKSKRKKIGKILIVLGLCFYWFFSITPVSDLILSPLENKYPPVSKVELNKAERIVLLLGGKESDPRRANEVLRLRFLKGQPFKIIISGRDPLNPEKKEAEEIKTFLVERGITPQNIILENNSRNTKENAKNTKAIVGDEPFFLVTSAYHLPRAMEIFKKIKTTPIPAPTDFKIEKNYDILDFFPHAKNLRKTNLAFHEYLALLYLKIFD
ncbi:YdcF family protein [bacterium]|nr:YdcF family protein [bacterium]